MTPSSCLSLQTAALPFVLPWKTLVQDLNVISLGPAPEGWKRLLAGQGISLEERKAKTLPQGCQVVSGFDWLDGMTESTFFAWAEAALAAFAPGGILVLGGTEPEVAAVGQPTMSSLRTAQLLEAVGYARVRVLAAAAPHYALVAQTPAQGAAFDIFSPAFLTAPSLTANTPLAQNAAAQRQFEERLAAQTHRMEAELRDLFLKTQTNLRDQLHRTAIRLNDQQAEIDGLRTTIAELQRLTRRRGLRKLAHKIKQARRKDKESPAQLTPPAPAETTPSPAAQAAPAPLASPTPLSAREARLRAALFDNGNA